MCRIQIWPEKWNRKYILMLMSRSNKKNLHTVPKQHLLLSPAHLGTGCGSTRFFFRFFEKGSFFCSDPQISWWYRTSSQKKIILSVFKKSGVFFYWMTPFSVCFFFTELIPPLKKYRIFSAYPFEFQPQVRSAYPL